MRVLELGTGIMEGKGGVSSSGGREGGRVVGGGGGGEERGRKIYFRYDPRRTLADKI